MLALSSFLKNKKLKGIICAVLSRNPGGIAFVKFRPRLLQSTALGLPQPPPVHQPYSCGSLVSSLCCHNPSTSISSLGPKLWGCNLHYSIEGSLTSCRLLL